MCRVRGMRESAYACEQLWVLLVLLGAAVFYGSVVFDTVDINVLLGHFNKNFLTVQPACHFLTPSFIHSLSKYFLSNHYDCVWCWVLGSSDKQDIPIPWEEVRKGFLERVDGI